eukprot:XP_011671711.1 PREDICTED: uncharacterized protein LOC105441859 [Strongylocentrotus purpuratus]
MSYCISIMAESTSTTLCNFGRSKEENTDFFCKNHTSLYESLPPDYAYHICNYQEVADGKYEAEFRIDISNEDDAKLWLEKYQQLTKVTFRVGATKLKNGWVNLFKVFYRCQHKTLPRSETASQKMSSKNTNCPAKLAVTVKKIPGKLSRAKSKDLHLPAYQTVVKISHTHNHMNDSADTLKHRDVSKETIEKFKDLFSKGHSPASALNTHKLDLQLQYDQDYVYEAADRANCPDTQFCHRLYRKIFDKAYGAASGEKMLSDLEAAIAGYNSEVGEVCAKIDQVNNKIAIALCSPLMKRCSQKHEYSRELVFIDATGGMDRYDCRVFMLLTHSAAGGLPVGCLIVTSESRDCITLALKLYLDIIPKDAFFGRGTLGPRVFLSDDSEAERQSLAAVFPDATLILCVFHLLQAVWRFLWEGKNQIRKEHRPQLLFAVKKMTFSMSENTLEEAYEELQGSDVARLYPNFLAHVEKLYSRRQAWAVCYRQDLPTRGNNTNNYAEAAMRILKDQIFERVRAYNVVQLFDFLVTRVSSYYERRLTDLANGRVDVTVSRKYLPGGSSIPATSITKIGAHCYEVKSETKEETKYNVDTEIGVCTCITGMNGAPCKHQYAVVRHFNETSLNFLPLRDPHLREHMLFLATGQKNVRPGWFTSLPIAGLPLEEDPGVQVPDQMGSLSDDDNVVESECPSVASVAAPSSSNVAVESLNVQRMLQNKFDMRGSGPLQSNVDGGEPPCNDKLASLEAAINDCASQLIAKLKRDPEELSEPVESYVKQFNSLKTNSALVGALKNFGKYTGASLDMTSSKKKKQARRKGVAIKVQPAAVSRRKTVLGGRRCLHTGRKLRELKKRKTVDSSQLIPKKKPRKAPHSLSQCVTNNEGIGQNKSSKW